MHKLKDMPFTLTDRVEDGLGFRIGDHSFAFSLATTDVTGREFIDSHTGLHVHVGADQQENALVIRGTLKNHGNTPVSGISRIDPLHIIFRNPSSAWRHIYAQGGTTQGFYPPEAYRTCERTCVTGKMRIESHALGRSSNLNLPFLISLASRSPNSEGLFCGMEWSGGWHMTWDPVDAERSALSVGVKATDLTLMPGEVLTLPNVHIGFFKGGPDAGTNALRRHLYTHVCPLYQGKRLRPKVSYDHWFGLDNRINIDVMKRQAKRAAELGIEVFVVDAGWFAGGFPDGVGNWNSVDQEKFPDGLEPLAEYVRRLDMDFGLWFEIERASEGTQALRQHPELFISVPPTYSGNRLHLNLARRDAQDWAIETVGGWIRRLDLKWSRWDYNIEPQPFWDAVDPSGKIQFDYMAGLYHVLDTLMAAHPEWMVEGCASGGRRIDMGTMKRAHTFWFSDHSTSAAICRYMQARANRFLPGHLLNSSVAVSCEKKLAHRHGDGGFNDVSVLSRMLGKLAFDGDVASWSPALTGKMARWTKEFKAIRHLLVQDFYQLLPMPCTAEDADAVQFVSYGGDEAVAFVFAGCTGKTFRLRLRGLDADLNYTVAQSPGDPPKAYSGLDLMEIGIPIALLAKEAGLWRIVRSNNRIHHTSLCADGAP